MSERELPESGVLETQQTKVPAQASAGQQLRQAREAAGLHVAALAGALKVPVRKLEALEADDYAAFSDNVFMRALASSICRTLGLEPQPVLDQLPRSAPKGFEAQRMHLNAPIKERAGKSGGGMTASSSGGGVSRKAIVAVVVLLLGAAAVYFLPSGILDSDDAGDGTAVSSQPVEITPPPAAPAAALPAASLADAPAATALLVAPAAETAPAAAPAATAVVETPAVAASVPAATEAAQLPGQAPLVFNTSGPSWVQVTDAHGKVVLSKNLGAGETAQVSAEMPVRVVVGRAAVATLQVRGQPFDIAAAAPGKDVARFEVK